MADPLCLSSYLLAGPDGFGFFADTELLSPPLLWPEVRSALHQIAWRRQLPKAEVASAHERLSGCPVTTRDPALLGRRAWDIADRFGWTKTYDAEYLALAELLDCRLVTLDRRLRDRVDDATQVVGPADLLP